MTTIEHWLANLSTLGGLTVYNVDTDFVTQVKTAATTAFGKRCQVFQASRIAKKAPKLDATAKLIIVHQDLASPDHFLPFGDLVEQILYPALQKDIPFCLLSELDSLKYAPRSHDPKLVHEEWGLTQARLLCEQAPHIAKHTTVFRHPQQVAFDAITKPVPASATAQMPVASLDQLDPRQTQALEHDTGPMLVLAPAGSGKTRTLVNRIIHLINNGADPERILALAFNRKAMEEMNSRLQQRGVNSTKIRTFHSLGYEFIRSVLPWRFSQDRVYAQRRNLIQRSIGAHYEIPRGKYQDVFEHMNDAFQRIRTELSHPDDHDLVIDGIKLEFAPIFESYLKNQFRNQFIDFTDMVYLTVRMLLKNETWRTEWQSKFDYVIVDEFQDLNRSQLLLMQLMAWPQNNLFVVGDDDQLIYSWRGAAVSHIREFRQEHPAHKLVVLNTNYRSCQAVVKHSRRLIENNRSRVSKDIQARDDAPAGTLEIQLEETLWEQAQTAAKWLVDQSKAGQNNWRNYAALFRYHVYQFPLAKALDAHGIPHTPIDELRLFQTNVGRDLHAYLSVLLHPEEATTAQVRRVLKRPVKYLTNKTVGSIENWQGLKRAPAQSAVKSHERDQIRDFILELQLVRRFINKVSTKPTRVLGKLERQFNLLDFYAEQAAAPDAGDQATDDVVFEIIQAVAHDYPDVHAFFSYINDLLSDAAQNAQSRSKPAADQEPGVLFTTVHQAKGKEFENVIYFNLERVQTQNQREEEEERRIAYVAVTRAEQNLLVTAPEDEFAPFLEELLYDPELAKLTVQDLKKRLLQMEKDTLKADVSLSDLAALNAQINQMELEIRWRETLEKNAAKRILE